MVIELTRAGLEAEIARVISRFHEDQHGCKADRTVAYVVGDMVLVRSSGCYTGTEQRLAATEEGRKLVKSARRELRSLNRRQVESLVAEIVGVLVLRSFWDLDVRVGEQVEVYVLEQDLTEKIRS
ncbi:MAG: hypothetical protein QOJ65_106 [Fimbriimonadaceae bacterium]|jgi:uncharacterized protein YbcI|nr:hypothetical protein [Fimbriimonadaceae bacterium]